MPEVTCTSRSRAIATIVSATLLGAGLTAPAARSAPGDLDDTFGSHGRADLPQDLTGAVWALSALEPDGYGVAAGDEYCYYYSWYCQEYFEFAARLDAAGVMVPGHDGALPSDFSVRGAAWQPDGKLVAIGWSASLNRHVAFRLKTDGQLDATFGVGGIASLPGSLGLDSRVTVDPDGRITILHLYANAATMFRLMEDGSVDASFGSGGSASLAAAGSFNSIPTGGLLSMSGGGYRAIGLTPDHCGLLGVTAAGAPDGSLGAAGVVEVESSSGSRFYCDAIGVQSDGSLVVGGFSDGQAEAVRLSAGGVPDGSYHTDAGEHLKRISALSVAQDDSTYVAGPGASGAPGAVVARLLTSGNVDTAFGDLGEAWIDPAHAFDDATDVTSVVATRAGEVVIGGRVRIGGDLNNARPFLIRLTTDGEGAGQVGVRAARVDASESSGGAQVRVRRIGGSKGAVSVAYRAAAYAGYGTPATVGTDFQQVQGQLDWADGDASERTVIVPLLPDAPGYERPEHVIVTLDPVEGTALGTASSLVEIRGDAYPAGGFSIAAESPTVIEGNYARFLVSRRDYRSGTVSVKVTAVSGTATVGTDFDPVSVTLTWGDGDQSDRLVSVRTNRTDNGERAESFSATLSDPTNGAILLQQSSAQVTIANQDSGGSGGGGSTGLATLLWLFASSLLRRPRR